MVHELQTRSSHLRSSPRYFGLSSGYDLLPVRMQCEIFNEVKSRKKESNLLVPFELVVREDGTLFSQILDLIICDDQSALQCHSLLEYAPELLVILLTRLTSLIISLELIQYT